MRFGLLALVFVVACGGGDDGGGVDGGGGGGGDAGASGADADNGGLAGTTYLDGLAAVNTIHVFEDWGGISRGFIAATKTGFVIQDFDADEPLVVADTVGDELFRARVIDVGGDYPYWAVGVGPAGFVATNIDVEGGTHGFFQVDPSSYHTTDIDILPGATPRLALANFEVGRVEVMRWNGFGFEEDAALRTTLAGVVAIEPLDDETILAATEPAVDQMGTLYQFDLVDGGETPTDEGDIGLQPRDIACNADALCVVTALGSDMVTPIDASALASNLRRRRVLRVGKGYSTISPSFVGLGLVNPGRIVIASELGVATFFDIDPVLPSITESFSYSADGDPVTSAVPVPGARELVLFTRRSSVDLTLTQIDGVDPTFWW